jgi:hypothetical protein
MYLNFLVRSNSNTDAKALQRFPGAAWKLARLEFATTGEAYIKYALRRPVIDPDKLPEADRLAALQAADSGWLLEGEFTEWILRV